MAITVSYGIAFATILTLILLPIFISLNNQVKVLFKWLVSGDIPTKESVERAIIEKGEEEKMDDERVPKNQQV